MSDDRTRQQLAEGTCVPCEGGTPALEEARISARLEVLPEWSFVDGRIRRTYRFRNYHQTMAFVNAVAWIAHQQDHHPELVVGYRTCEVSFSTHAIGGLSENDFVCAAKVDRLIGEAG